MKGFFTFSFILLIITTLSAFSLDVVVKYDNDVPTGNCYTAARDRWEESVTLIPDGPCTVNKIMVYFSGNTPVKDTLHIVGYPTAGNLYPTEYIWDYNSLMDPIIFDYNGIPGWVEFNVSTSGLRSDGFDKIVVQHIMRSTGPWMTYDAGPRTSKNFSWMTDPFTPNPDFYNIQGTLYSYPPGNFMARLDVVYDYPDGNTSLPPPPPTLVDVSTIAGLTSTGDASVVDWNDDGWDDIVVGNNYFENQKDGTFVNVIGSFLLPGGLTSWGDFDNDGNIDVFIARGWGTDKLYRNKGDGSFEDVTAKSTIINNYPLMTALWVDYNGDGYLDLFLANNRTAAADGTETYYPDQLWKNNGDGTFTNVTEASGIAAGEPAPYFDCYGAAATDYNKDNLPDIFVANYRLAKDNLYKNNGNGTFTEVGAQTGVQGVPTADPNYFGHGMGCQWADFNNDTYVDLCVGNLAHTDSRGVYSNPSLIFRNDGPPNFTFTEVHKKMGLKFHEGNAGVCWLDLNNDIYLDLWHGKYDGGTGTPYLNMGAPDFKLKDMTWLYNNVVQNPWTAERIDFNNDGREDIIIAGKLYRNDVANTGNWVSFRLKGKSGSGINMSCYGSKMTLYAGQTKLFRELAGSAAGTHTTQNTNELHFGLGDISTIDSVVLVYPNGKSQKLMNLLVNAKYKITYMEDPIRFGLATPALISPINYAFRQTGEINFTWNPVGAATKYTIQISDVSDFQHKIKEETVTQDNDIISNLPGNSILYWRVKAASYNESGAYSQGWIFYSGTPQPSAPNLHAPTNALTKASIKPTFGWTPITYIFNFGNYTSFTLQISKDESFSTVDVEIKGLKDTIFTLTEPLQPGITYNWRVCADNYETPGPWSVIWKFTTIGMPGKSTLTTPVNGAIDQIVKILLKWQPVQDAEMYHLQLSTASDFSSLYFEKTDITNTSYKFLRAVETGTTYYWRIQATNGAGIGEWSEGWNFKTVMLPRTPKLLFPANGDLNIVLQPELKWSKAELTDSYAIQISVNNTFTDIFLDKDQLTDTVLSIQDQLSKNRQYFWRIRGTNTLGNGDWSDGWNFKTINPGAVDDVPVYNNLIVNSQPNPFSENTEISFITTNSEKVDVSILNILGKEVAKLQSGFLPSGTHTLTWQPGNLPQGMYYCRVVSGKESRTVGLLYVK